MPWTAARWMRRMACDEYGRQQQLERRICRVMSRLVFFDLSVTKILVLGVLALMIFGPEQLPRIAAQAGRALRDLRRLAENAKAELQEGLGPEFSEFDLNDLNPRSFVRKHL